MLNVDECLSEFIDNVQKMKEIGFDIPDRNGIDSISRHDRNQQCGTRQFKKDI